MTFKSGFVSVIGRPNVGKSTLINKILGQKITITSHKPQTTRNKIQTIYNSPGEGQIVFVDTPGIHKAKNELDEYMLKQAYKGLDGIDIVLFMVDGTSSFGKGDNFILKQIKGGPEIIVVMNKIDQLSGKLMQQRKKQYHLKTGLLVVPVSARTGKNVDFLIKKIMNKLPEGPQYYPEDMITDQIERFVIGEMVREKAFNLIREEIPYGIAVVVEEVKERENDLIYIRANIYVEKKSHKGIIIGKNGKMLRKIGKEARGDIEKLLQSQVYLDLWVKVQKDWRNNNYLLRQMGYK